jgi:hypothetical protein
MKRCSICKKEKEYSEFIPKQNSKDGFTNYCKSCQKESSANYALNNPIKTCNCCGENKDINEFPKLNNSLSGYGNKCKFCHNSRTLQYWEQTKDVVNKNRKISSLSKEKHERVKELKRKNAKKHLESGMLLRARKRAKEKGLDFNIELSDIIIPEYCPLLNVKLTANERHNYRYNPSLDRIDSSKGYIKGNIQVISNLANVMKNNATPEELIAFAKNILKIYDIV